jgi:hypothetical protein
MPSLLCGEPPLAVLDHDLHCAATTPLAACDAAALHAPRMPPAPRDIRLMDPAPRIEVALDFIRSKRPCSDGYRWLLRRHETRSNYQTLLDELVAQGRAADACWLLDQLGPTDEVLSVDNLCADALVFAGTVTCRGSADVGGLLRVGRRLKVDGGLRVEGDLTVGEELRVAGAVHCAGHTDIGSDARIGWSLSVGRAFTCGGRARVGWDAEISGPARIQGSTVVGQALTVGEDFECLSTVKTGGDLTAAGTVDVRLGIVSAGSVRSARHLQTGWGIRAAHDIVADGAIRAGETLQAGGRIASGDAYGVFAGLVAPIDAWPSSGYVTAACKPERLLSGWWAEA